jgi:hypothetical protein
MMPQIEARSERLQTDDDQHDESGGNVSAKPRQSSSLSRAAPSAAAITASAAAVGAGATASCTSRPQWRQTVASALHRLRAVRALLHSGREQSLFERVRVRLQQNGGRRSPLPERFTLPVSD